MITYPLSLPTNHGLARVVFRARTVVGLSRSPFTGSQQVYQWPGVWWEAECTLPQMIRADADVWTSFLVSLRGLAGTFLLWDPAAKTPRGTVPGAPVVNGANQTGIQLLTRGWTASQTGILLPGDYIQVGPSASVANRRLYKVLTQANSDGSGNATLDIFPRLRESPGDGDTITTTNCQGTFRLADNQMQWDVDAAKIYGIGFKAIEAF
jgi:hypothetical protein